MSVDQFGVINRNKRKVDPRININKRKYIDEENMIIDDSCEEDPFKDRLFENVRPPMSVIMKRKHITPNIFKDNYLKTLEDYDNFIKKYQEELAIDYLKTYNNEEYKTYVKQYIELQFHFQNKKSNINSKFYGGDIWDVLDKVSTFSGDNKNLINDSVSNFETNYSRNIITYANNVIGNSLVSYQTTPDDVVISIIDSQKVRLFHNYLENFIRRNEQAIEELITSIDGLRGLLSLKPEEVIMYSFMVIMKMFMYLIVNMVLTDQSITYYYLYVGFLIAYIRLNKFLYEIIKDNCNPQVIDEYLMLNGLTPLPRELGKCGELAGTCAYNSVLIYLNSNNPNILPKFIHTSYEKICKILRMNEDIDLNSFNNLHLSFKINIAIVLLQLDEKNICYDTNRILTYDRINNTIKVIKPNDKNHIFTFALLNTNVEIVKGKIEVTSTNIGIEDLPKSYIIHECSGSYNIERFLYDSPLQLGCYYFKPDGDEFIHNGGHIIVLENNSLNKYIVIDPNYENNKLNTLRNNINSVLIDFKISNELNKNTIIYNKNALKKINYTNLDDYDEEESLEDKLKTNSITLLRTKKIKKLKRSYDLYSINSTFKYFNLYDKFTFTDYKISNEIIDIKDYIYYFIYDNSGGSCEIIYKHNCIKEFWPEELFENLIFSNNPFSNEYQIIILICNNFDTYTLDFLLYLGDLVFYNLKNRAVLKLNRESRIFTPVSNLAYVDFSLNFVSIEKIIDCVTDDISSDPFRYQDIRGNEQEISLIIERDKENIEPSIEDDEEDIELSIDEYTKKKGGKLNFKNKIFKQICLIVLIIFIVIVIVIIICVKYNSEIDNHNSHQRPIEYQTIV